MKKRLFAMLIVACLLLTLFPISAQAQEAVIYVSTSSEGSGDGSSWENATTLDAAWITATLGTKIFVKGGTYARTTTLALNKEISIYGGFAGTEQSEDERAKSDLDENGIVEPWEFSNPTTLTGSVRLFSGAKYNTIIDGLVLTSTASTTTGSVIQLYTGNVLKNSVVTASNNATRGVIYIDGGTLLSTFIYNNKTNSDRGCISVYYNNGSPATISHCRIEDNKAQYGGGIYSRAGSSVRVNVTNNLIFGNEATMRGGGAYFGSGSNPPTNVWFINNTVLDNTVSFGVYTEGGDGDGSGVFAEGGIYAYNNLIFGNTGPEGCQQVANSNKGGDFRFEYNAIENLGGIDWTVIDGVSVNDNNIDLSGSETLFDYFYVPLSDSVLTDSGERTKFPDYVANSISLLDLKDARRVQGGQIDIGAYEYDAPDADPQISIEDEIVIYDGTPKTLTATTVPSGLPVAYTYNGLADAPSDIGVYTVVASVDYIDDDILYKGSQSATLDIRAPRTIVATAGPNGAISPSGTIIIPDSTSKSFTITPNAKYMIDTLLVDGVAATHSDGVYTFERVTDDHTIEVTFRLAPLTITATAGDNGTISPSGTVSVESGANQEFVITPNVGYLIDTVLVDGVEVTHSDGVYTFENVTEDHTIEVTFTPKTYALTIVAESGGSIEIGSNGDYAEGEIINIKAKANTNYRFNEWTSSAGGTFGSETSASTTFVMPANAVTISASFTYTGGGGGGGGGGIVVPIAPTYYSDIFGLGDNKVQVKVDVNSDEGKVLINLEGIVDNLDGRDIKIKAPLIPNIHSYTLTMPSSVLSDNKGQGSIELCTDIGCVTLPSDMLYGNTNAKGKKFGITIGEGDKTKLSGEAKQKIGNRPLIDINATLDGAPISWNNTNAPITVSIPYNPTVLELSNSECIVVWYIDSSGNLVCVPNGRYDAKTKTVVFDITHLSSFAVGYNKMAFNDVPANAWYKAAVNYLSARGAMNGTGGNKFSPLEGISRGEFLVMIMRAYGINPDLKTTSNFTDSGNTYYTGYLAAAKRLGISQGVGNNMFKPNKKITRQEMFVLLHNTLKSIGQLPEGNAKKTLSHFGDSDKIASWAKSAMELFVKTGVVSGSEGMLSPTNTSTRADAAQLLYNLLSK